MPKKIRQRFALSVAAKFSVLAVVGSLLFGPPATADASAISLSPASQTVLIGQQLTDITPTVTGTTVNRLANLLNVRTIAGPSGASVSPATVTTTELVGIQAVVQVPSGDFYTLQRSMDYIAPTQPDTIAHVSRATGVTTVLAASAPLSGPISVQNIQADGSGNIYVAIGNDVVQLAITGNTYAETGRKVSFTDLVNFQVTDAGRVYGIGSSGTANEYNVFTAEIPVALSTVTATQYPSNGPVTFSSFDGVTGVYVDENIPGNSSNSRVFATTRAMAQVLMADVVNNVGSTTYGLSNNAGIVNFQYSSQIVMDDADNLYFLTQNNVRKINTAGFNSTSPLRVSEFQIGPEIVFDLNLSALYRNTAATAGYIDGSFGVSKIYTGGPIVTGSVPPSVNGGVYRTGGGLALDLKGSNPTGELIIADTGNAALRAMNRVGWSVTPELHAGLSLDSSGEITGTPTGVVGLTPATNTKTYTVSYHNTNGTVVSGTTNVTFEIAPTSFNYVHPITVSSNPLWGYIGLNSPYTWGTAGQGVFSINTPIPLACPATNVDTSGNTNSVRTVGSTCGSSELLTSANLGLPAATSFTISPALPAGVIFNTTTGAISGTPTAYSDVQNYTITATNAHGSAVVTMPFGVPEPRYVTYDSNGGVATAQTVTNGQATTIGETPTIAQDGPYVSGQRAYPGLPDLGSQFGWALEKPGNPLFAGWATNPTGVNAELYFPGEDIIISSNLALYALWAPSGSTYTADFDLQGATNSGSPIVSQTKAPGQRVSMTYAEEMGLDLAKPGHTFQGWNSRADGSGSWRVDGFKIYNNTTTYAIWQPNSVIVASSPSPLPLAGGNLILVGSGLGPSTGTITGISVGGVSVGSWQVNASGTQIALTAPALAAGTHQVVVTIGGNPVTYSLTYGSSGSQSQNATPGTTPGSQSQGSSQGLQQTYQGPIPSHLDISCIPEGQESVATLKGTNLDSITEASVAGAEIKLISARSDELLLEFPALEPGIYSVNYLSSHGRLTHQDSLAVCSSSLNSESVTPASSDSATVGNKFFTSKRFAGFKGDSALVTPTDLRLIKSFVAENSGISVVTCLARTSGPRIWSDVKLATDRAKNVCQIVSSLIPGVSTNLKARIGEGTGQAFRSVSIFARGTR